MITILLEELVFFTLVVEMDAVTLTHTKREKLIINLFHLSKTACFEERTEATLLQVWHTHACI